MKDIVVLPVIPNVKTVYQTIETVAIQVTPNCRIVVIPIMSG